jgi:hypothetical protein
VNADMNKSRWTGSSTLWIWPLNDADVGHRHCDESPRSSIQGAECSWSLLTVILVDSLQTSGNADTYHRRAQHTSLFVSFPPPPFLLLLRSHVSQTPASLPSLSSRRNPPITEYLVPPRCFQATRKSYSFRECNHEERTKCKEW